MKSVLNTKLYLPVRVREFTTLALTFLDSGRTGAFISLLMFGVDTNIADSRLCTLRIDDVRR